jgi:hypothetical protein
MGDAMCELSARWTMLECAMSKAFLKNGSLILISVEGRPEPDYHYDPSIPGPPSVERILTRAFSSGLGQARCLAILPLLVLRSSTHAELILTNTATYPLYLASQRVRAHDYVTRYLTYPMARRPRTVTRAHWTAYTRALHVVTHR